MLTLYSDSSDFIYNDATLAGSYTDPTPPVGAVDDGAIVTEIDRVRAIKGWTNSADTQYWVLPTAGANVPGAGGVFCARHNVGTGLSATYYYALTPWPADYPLCDVPAAATLFVSHEYGETSTDPTVGGGWYTAHGVELADLCEGYDAQQLPGNGPYVTYLWDNYASHCHLSIETPFPASDVYVVKMHGTGTGTTEIHVLRGGEEWKAFKIHTGSVLGLTNPAMWQFVTGALNGNGLRDIIAIYTRCGSGTTDVHILDGGASYQSTKLNRQTVLGEVSPANWSFVRGHDNGSGNPDLIAICMRTCSATTEIHVMSAATNYSTWRLNTASALGPTSPDQWKFVVGADTNSNSYPDINAIRMKGGCGATEVHVLSGGTSYTTLRRNVCTSLSETNPQEWQFAPTDITGSTGLDDVMALRMNGALNRTEVHLLDADTTSATFLRHIATAQYATNPLDFVLGSNVWYTGLDNFSVSGPSSMSVKTGGSGTAQITAVANNAFLGGVALSASGVPIGSSVSFTPSSISVSPSASGASTMKVTIPQTQLTNFTVTVKGCGGSANTCHTFAVTVKPSLT